MNALVIALAAASLVPGVPALAGAEPQSSQYTGTGQTPTPSPNQTPAPDNRPARVRVKLDGFDLASQSSKPGQTAKRAGTNQIGGASRGLGGLALFAPEKGLAYTQHPVFQWSGPADAKYKLVLEDLASHTSYEAAVTGNSFSYPDGAPELKPGSTYSWTVQPEIELMGGQPSPVLIVIAGGSEREQIASALAAITQTGFEGDKARAQVYFDKRAWYDAAAAYSALIASHPDDPGLHKMRGTLYDQVDATQKLADADFAMAK